MAKIAVVRSEELIRTCNILHCQVYDNIDYFMNVDTEGDDSYEIKL